MKILLDENLPHELRHELAAHEVFTVHYMGWQGTQNGELLRRAAASGFDALLTMDSGVPYEQNLTTLLLTVIVLQAPSNDIDDLRPLVPRILNALAQLERRTVLWIG